MDEPTDDLAALPDELTITLRKPVKFGDATYATLELREPTGAEWLVWDKLTGVEANIKAIATVSGLPEGAVRQIGARDLVEAGRFIDHFF